MQLNQAQKDVIRTLEDNVLLIASAGTGKTNTLSIRIAKVISLGLAKPEEILCLTFTNKACREMRDRVETVVGEKAGEIVIRTFHSFCYDIIRTEAKAKTDIFSDFIIFDEEDSKEVIKLIKGQWDTGAVQNFIKLVKEARIRYNLFTSDPAEDYAKAVKLLYANDLPMVEQACQVKYRTDFTMTEAMRTDGTGLVLEYDEYLKEAHGVDFTDLTVMAYELLLDRDIEERWKRAFRFINIDEMQDTSEIEYSIISRLFGTNHLLLSGDYFQTIYEWRHSNPVKIQEMYMRTYHPEVIVFYENFRATKLLLNASTDYLKDIFRKEMERIYPHQILASSPEEGEKIILHGAEDMMEEARWIHREIERLQVTDYSKVCILSRNNNYNSNLSSCLSRVNEYPNAKKFPFMLIDAFQFFRRQEIKDVLAFMKLAVNPFDSTSLERVLGRFGKGIGKATVEHIQSPEARSAGIRLTDFVDPVTHRTGDCYGELLRRWRENRIVVFDVESTGVDTTSDEIIQIAAIRLNQDGSAADSFVHYVRSSKSVGKSEAVHHISDRLLEEKGREPQAVFEEFRDFIKGCVIVGHNVTYDINILMSEMSRLGMKPLESFIFYDTLNIFRRFYPNLRNHKLEFLGEFCGVTHKSTHDAFDDICATGEILLYAIRKNILPTADSRRQHIAKYLDKFRDMSDRIEKLRGLAAEHRPHELVADVVDLFGIKDYYEGKKELQRIQNLRQMYVYVRDMDEPELSARDSMQQVIMHASLAKSELDAMLKKNPKIPIITIHQAKGMEFEYVFLAGLMDYIFPSYNAIKSKNLKEEQRLFYVAITRAKSRLYLSWSQQYGDRERIMSRLIESIPRKYVETV